MSFAIAFWSKLCAGLGFSSAGSFGRSGGGSTNFGRTGGAIGASWMASFGGGWVGGWGLSGGITSGCGGGLAYGKKMKLVASIYSTFLQRAFDNLFHDVCLQELPVIFAIDRAGIAGPDGSTHHGIYDISFLNAMPNMIITQPRNGHVLRELLESAFMWGRPAAIRYPNMATEEFDQPLMPREIGKGEVLVEGSQILLIGLGHMNNTALK